MSEIVNNTFWAVFYGSTLGNRNLELLMQEWEDLED